MRLDPAICRQAMLARDARFDGRFFTCVKSTGIYCRPICPARPPKLENCIFLPTAAAAQEAGFRPCLRCRPETAPELGAWRGTSNTVSRALALIESGALDEGNVEALGDRLGVGGRQLRRLFMRHLGASPVAVAQTRRVLLAKQLIHETELSMAEVAFAAGFGSVRRFNETFATLFGRPPRALRRDRHDGVTNGSTVTLSLGYRPPYDWNALLAFLAARAIPGVEAVEGQVYRRTIEIAGAAGWVSVAHEPARNRLRATIHFSRLSALPLIVARLRWIFDLAADPDVIRSALSHDPRLAALVAARPGLRVPGAWDGFELAVRAILGQQISVSAATQLAGRIAQKLGEPLGGSAAVQGLTRLFPRPDVLARAKLSGMPAARAAALSSMAGIAAADPSLFDRERDLGSSVAKLRRLPGIGEWTAQYIAMRAMREPDAFPAADVGLMRAMDDGAGRPNATELLGHAERWHPWRAYATLHLWASRVKRPAVFAEEEPSMRLRLDRIASAVGDILLVHDGDDRLRALDFEDYESRMRRLLRLHYGSVELSRGNAPATTVEALRAYFAGEYAALDSVPIATGGTPFQRDVWAALRGIPPGQTMSYGSLATRIGRPKGVRALDSPTARTRSPSSCPVIG